MNKLLIYAAFLILISSCIETYSPNLEKYEDVFVVDGELTNLPGPYKVKLSRSYKYDEFVEKPVVGAQLKIIDNSGFEIDLYEINDGDYSTADSDFQGIIGHSYKLQIKYKNQIYESEFEQLKAPVPIDEVYWKYNNNPDTTEAVQIMLNTYDNTNSTRYYAWDYTETWEIRSPVNMPPYPEWLVCYKNATNSKFIINTSIQRENDIINDQPLTFMSENTERLYYRYSILVRQYALKQDQYKFLHDLITINQNQGSLFDPMPASILGNIKNTLNPEIPVLGYFMVVGVSEKRFFIDRDELPLSYNPTNGYDGCEGEAAKIPWKDKSIPWEITDVTSDPVVDSLLYLGYIEYERALWMNNIIVKMAYPPCYNCTMHGTNETPDFWNINN